MQLPEPGDKFTPEHAAQDPYGEEERVARTDPALAIRRESSRRNHAVHMRVMEKVLPPGVKNAEESDLGAEMLRIGGHFKQRGRAGAEQKSVKQLLVVIRQRRELMRQREDNMNIGRREKLSLTRGEPLVAC